MCVQAPKVSWRLGFCVWVGSRHTGAGCSWLNNGVFLLHLKAETFSEQNRNTRPAELNKLELKRLLIRSPPISPQTSGFYPVIVLQELRRPCALNSLLSLCHCIFFNATVKFLLSQRRAKVFISR